MARSYKRDARGRFSGGGGSGGGGKKGKAAPKVTAKGKGVGGERKGSSMGRDMGQTSNPRGTIAAGSFNNRSKVNNRMKVASPANDSGAQRRMSAKLFGAGGGTTVNQPAAKAKAASKGGGKKPKTAAGRASANLRQAEKARMRNPFDKKAANKAITAQAAKEYYKDFGGGRKGAAKPTRKRGK